MRWMLVFAAVAGLFSADPARAEGEAAGDFDYYVMSLSWSPSYCALEGAAEGDDQCRPGSGFGWMLHGLWPQKEQGWPSYCNTTARDPSRRQSAAMADIMGSGGLAWYQWKKHGRCAGLSAEDYFALAREAWGSVTRPDVLRRLDESVRVPASVIEEAWLQANPALSPDMVTITCQDGRISETRICLTKALVPRVCGPDVRRDCRDSRALFDPVK